MLLARLTQPVSPATWLFEVPCDGVDERVDPGSLIYIRYSLLTTQQMQTARARGRVGDWWYRGTAHWTFGTEKIQKTQDELYKLSFKNAQSCNL